MYVKATILAFVALVLLCSYASAQTDATPPDKTSEESDSDLLSTIWKCAAIFGTILMGSVAVVNIFMNIRDGKRREKFAEEMEKQRQRHLETLEENRDKREEEKRKKKAHNLLSLVVLEMDFASKLLVQARKSRENSAEDFQQLFAPVNIPKCDACRTMLFENFDLTDSYYTDINTLLHQFVVFVDYLRYWDQNANRHSKEEIEEGVRNAWLSIAHFVLMFVVDVKEILDKGNFTEEKQSIMHAYIDCVEENIVKGFTKQDATILCEHSQRDEYAAVLYNHLQFLFKKHGRSLG